MSREWKPGDVALAYDDTRLIRVRPVMSGTRNDYWVDDEGDRRDLNSTQVRPLVVIDPEDREQVERLHDAVFRNSQLMCDRDDLGYDETQAALREFADPKPPKPEEPTGPLTNNELAAVRRLLAERDS